MANKFAKDFENSLDRDFGSFEPKSSPLLDETGAKQTGNNQGNKGTSAASEGQKKANSINPLEQVKQDAKADVKAALTDGNMDLNSKEEQSQPVEMASKSAVRKGLFKAGKSLGSNLGSKAGLGTLGSKTTGALTGLKGLGTKVLGSMKGVAASVSTAVTKAGGVVAGALNVSTTVGTAIVLSGSVAAATIPTAGLIGYGAIHRTQRTDGCVPDEYDGPVPLTGSEGAQGAIDWAIKIANDDSFTYGSFANRKAGCYFCKTRSDKHYSCMPFITAAYAHGTNDPDVLALCEKGHSFSTYLDSDWENLIRKKKFTKVGECSDLSFSDLKPGDVLVTYASDDKSGHIAMYIGDNNIVEAGKPGESAESIQVAEGVAQQRFNRLKGGGLNFVMRYTGKGSGSSAADSNVTVTSTSPSSLVEDNVWIGEAAWGNSPGDQSGREVYYHEYRGSVNGGSWNYVIRAKDDSVKVRLADAMIKACDNDHIGYNDGGTDLYYEAEKVGWDLTKITKDTSTQCSYVVDVCLRCAGIDEQYAKADTASIYIWNVLEPSGQFEKLTSIPSNSELLPGDILIRANSPGSGYLGHVAMVVKSPAANRLSPLFGGADNNELIAGMTADDGCGGEMDGAQQAAAYIGKGMKKITASNGQEYIVLDADYEQVKKLGHQGPAQCYIYSIGYCDLILGGKFRCSIEGSEDTRYSNMRSAYGSGEGENGNPGNIGGQQKNVASTEAMRKLAIDEIKQGRPVIFYVNNSQVGGSGMHWVCVCGWRADAGADPKWDDLVCCDPAYAGSWGEGGGDGLRDMKVYPDHGGHTVATFEGWTPAAGQTRRSQ